ncbi:hypothetical protein HRW16_05360 [Streptomyces lunaelactis]|uniref:hypothetical protein n=1 Tax=Streptomyces lunaelactis TaxID=1535768 RepID=UPI001585611A|nr:hypothetical protein [Streptomyces lunaelactis]NUK32549.1 hypothetical protein [Streptomyces lunaelactis]NUK41304.1 hypothetical protein [Streptomyces lunaelactis]NUK55844.1 hypothetical protein [Streptomyces lunaelactis]NUK91303.1 hypothetical protein [Streptomyces lunaelactis]NUL29624.1 hypothetical protein [Streptomyces lunaelactis]
MRWGAVASPDKTALQAPFRSGVSPQDYQLDPVVRALAMPRINRNQETAAPAGPPHTDPWISSQQTGTAGCYSSAGQREGPRTEVRGPC